MNIKQLTELVKNKLEQNITCEKIQIQDKTFLHKNHKTHQKKISFKVNNYFKLFKKKNKIESTKEIYRF